MILMHANCADLRAIDDPAISCFRGLIFLSVTLHLAFSFPALSQYKFVRDFFLHSRYIHVFSIYVMVHIYNSHIAEGKKLIYTMKAISKGTNKPLSL